MKKKCCLMLFILLLLMIAGSVFSDPDNVRRDTLRYKTSAEAIKIWTPAMGGDCAKLLTASGQGLIINDIKGDMHEKDNNQRAVFIKKPDYDSNYFIEVTVSDFTPSARYSQAGLILWNDEDNYIRYTVGFNPNGLELLGEFGGKALSNGVYAIYPERLPMSVRLRIEVGRKSVTGYYLKDGKIFSCMGGFTFPEGKDAGSFIKGVGIMGAQGGVTEKPLFSDWASGQIDSVYADDDFSGDKISPKWRLAVTNAGWGCSNDTFCQHGGKFRIKPFSGSDIFLGNFNYPFIGIPAPKDERWTVEIKMSDFPASVKGRWNKGGIILSQANHNSLMAYLVNDEQEDEMYFEVLNGSGHGSVKVAGFLPKKKTDVYIRVEKAGKNKFILKASTDGVEWKKLGNYNIKLDEAQLRLFASGDITMQHIKDYNFAVDFDYIKEIKH